MLRRLSHFTVALSLALFAVAAVIWVRSYWVSDTVDWDRPGSRINIGSTRGEMWWDRIRYPQAAPVRFSRETGYHRQRIGAMAGNTMPPQWSFADFHWANFNFSRTSPVPGVSIQDLRIPDWSILLITGVLPAAWLISRWSVRRRSLGLCARCGYDLRATPDRCPECGTRVPPPVLAVT